MTPAADKGSSPLIADPGPAASSSRPNAGADDPLLDRDRPTGGAGELAPYVPELEPLEPDVFWEERQVRALLVPTGIGANKLVGAGHPEAFKFSEDDLQAIAPGLTNYLNRWDVTRAAARAGDEAALFVAFGQYGLRSVRQRGAAIALQRELDSDPNLERESGLADAVIPPGFDS